MADGACDSAVLHAGRGAESAAFIRAFDATLKNEFAGCDDSIALACAEIDVRTAVSPSATNVMLHTLLALPQGVQAMSVDFPGRRRRP